MKKLLIVAGLIGSGIFAQASIKDSLVAHFTFTNGSLTDETGIQDAELVAGTLTSVPDRHGNDNAALYFDGQTYLTAGEDTRGLTKDVSISFWFATNTQLDESAIVVSKYNGAASSDNNGIAIFYIDSLAVGGRDKTDSFKRTEYTSEVYNDSLWHHVVGTRDSMSTWKLYLDGELKSELVADNEIPNSTINGDLWIGGHTLWRPAFFTGALDDIRVYNRAITADDVTELYACAQDKRSTVEESICDNEKYTFVGTDLTDEGSYEEKIPTECNDCDSIINLELTVYPTYEVDNPQVLCAGETLSVGDSVYKAAGEYKNVLTSIAGCDSVVNTVITDCATSVTAHSAEVVLMPNPVVDILTVYGDAIASVSIFDSHGMLLVTSSETVIDMSALPKGSYLVEIEHTDGEIVQKLLIKQ